MGETVASSSSVILGMLEDKRPDGAVNQTGTVFGSYVHGIFDNPVFTEKLLNNILAARGRPALTGPAPAYANFREAEYDRLADMVEAHLDVNALERIINTWPSRP